MITKKIFVEVLEILENDGCIDSFQFYKNENAIKVCSPRDDAIYHFNENDILINPELFEIQKKINELEKEKARLKKKINNIK